MMHSSSYHITRVAQYVLDSLMSVCDLNCILHRLPSCLIPPSTGNQLALADGESGTAAGGFELVIPSNSGGTKILGSREFARYYRQGHRHVVRLDSVVVNTMLAK